MWYDWVWCCACLLCTFYVSWDSMPCCKTWCLFREMCMNHKTQHHHKPQCLAYDPQKNLPCRASHSESSPHQPVTCGYDHISSRIFTRESAYALWLTICLNAPCCGPVQLQLEAAAEDVSACMESKHATLAVCTKFRGFASRRDQTCYMNTCYTIIVGLHV